MFVLLLNFFEFYLIVYVILGEVVLCFLLIIFINELDDDDFNGDVIEDVDLDV